ncbi:MAG TPA: hypothetical protein VK507_08185, partial [Iamia sp.]|nr:hypothetical protein [Iamia sp.]
PTLRSARLEGWSEDVTSMSRRGLAAVTAVLVGVLLIPLPLIDTDRYTALAAGVQAAGVVLTLTYAAATLRADSHGRRVDRVLDLHLIADDPVHANGPTLAALRELAAWVRQRAARRGLDDWTTLVDRDFREGAFSDLFEGRGSDGR